MKASYVPLAAHVPKQRLSERMSVSGIRSPYWRSTEDYRKMIQSFPANTNARLRSTVSESALSRAIASDTPDARANRVKGRLGAILSGALLVQSAYAYSAKYWVELWKTGAYTQSPPVQVGSVRNPALTQLLECVGSPPPSTGLPVGFDQYYSGGWFWGYRSRGTGPLACGASPFNFPTQFTDVTPATFPDGQGWHPYDPAPVNVPNRRIVHQTGWVSTVEWFNPTTGIGSLTAGREIFYYQNKTGVTQPVMVPYSIPWPQVVPAPLPAPAPSPQPRIMPFRRIDAMAVNIDWRAGRVSFTPNPQARPVGGIGVRRYRHTRQGRKEGKLGGNKRAAAVAKVMFALLETVSDVRDLWDVLMGAFPKEVDRMSFREQLQWLSNPINWQYFDGEAFIKGFLEWYGQEVFYGRWLGRLEKSIGEKIGASNYFGVGVTSREWWDDPVTAATDFIFS